MEGILSPDKNPAYHSWKALPPSLWASTEHLDDQAFAIPTSGIRAANGEYRFLFLGETFLVCPKSRHMIWEETGRNPTFQEGLVALSLLSNFKPISLSEKWLLPIELPGCRTFFDRGSHPPKTSSVLHTWAASPDTFREVVQRLNGTHVSEGDDGVQIPCIPMVPLRYVFWKGEPALPPTVTLLVNAVTHLFLPPDVLWALINLTDRYFEISLQGALSHKAPK